MYETSTALNPVAAFECYLGKTHPDCKALFQTPNKATTKNMNLASAQHWYRNEPPKNTISKMMERISIKAELSERYTNHCICASTVTSLFQFQHGVDARKICAITKPYPLHQRDNKRTKKRMFKDFKGNISANNSLFSKKLQESRGKIAPARQPVLAQTQILSLFFKTNLFP